jgi:hypothetical protein
MALWSVGKWFLDPDTRNKVTPIYYLFGLRDEIDDKFLPRSIGGSSDYNYDYYRDVLGKKPQKLPTADVVNNDNNNNNNKQAQQQQKDFFSPFSKNPTQ